MEKSLAHWRATHPLLLITSSLCIGFIIANRLPYFKLNASIPFAIIIMLIGITLLLFIHQVKRAPILQGVFTIFILMAWGVALYVATCQYNLLLIPTSQTFVGDAREWIIQKLNKTLLDTEATGFAQAMLIGLKISVDKDLIKAYTQLGIVHIIAISGMHLDIIFKNLVYFTRWLPRKKVWLWLELLFILIAVWMYTLIASASPSIIRASIFFSLYFIGNFFNQSRYTLNSIAGGILVILFFDIHSLFHIGLQLSYAAVIGIHFLYPLFYKMLPMDNLILKWMWGNLCITLSAQLATLPILLYHFHQISTLLIISNFIMVPLTTLLLYALIILLLIPHQIKIGELLGHWIQVYIKIINHGVQYIYQHSLGSPLWIPMSGLQVLGFYVWLFLIYLWLLNRQAKYLLYSMVPILFFIVLKLFSVN